MFWNHHVSGRRDQPHFPTEPAQSNGEQIGNSAQPSGIATAGFDGDQFLERVEKRGFSCSARSHTAPFRCWAKVFVSRRPTVPVVTASRARSSRLSTT